MGTSLMRRETQERDAGKSEMQKAHARVRVARAKIGADSKEMVDQVRCYRYS